MTQKRLNHMHVVLLNTHKDQVDQMCIVDIAKQFISRKQARIDFLVHFTLLNFGCRDDTFWGVHGNV